MKMQPYIRNGVFLDACELPKVFHAKYYPGGPNKGLVVIEDQKIAKIAISQKVLGQYFREKKTSANGPGPSFPGFWALLVP